MTDDDRRRLAGQTERLHNSRRALMHILEDFHHSNVRLENGRKAMIHIMGDLRQTSLDVERREAELHEKQEQLVQAGKLATVGELTTGIAHELNNPLNNIGLFVGERSSRRMGDGYGLRAHPAKDRCSRWSYRSARSHGPTSVSRRTARSSGRRAGSQIRVA